MTTLKAKVKFINSLDKEGRNLGNKSYHYNVLIPDIETGDLVVVQTQFGYSVAEFIQYIDESEVKAEKFIVQKLELDSFEKYQEKLKTIKKLEKKIEKKAREALQRKKLNELAESDAELKVLLDTLDSLKA